MWFNAVLVQLYEELGLNDKSKHKIMWKKHPRNAVGDHYNVK